MAEISQIKVGNTTYDIKDATARNEKLDKAGGEITGNLAIEGTTYGINIDDLDQQEATPIILNCGTAGTSPIISERVPLRTVTPSSENTIDPYVIYNFGTVSQNIAITFGTVGVSEGYSVEYTFRFTAGAGCGIALPNGVKYNGGIVPTFTIGHVYEYSIIDNLVVVGEFY